MTTKTVSILVGALLVLALAFLWFMYGTQFLANVSSTATTTAPVATTTNSFATIRSFEDCVAAGYPVAESQPRQCRVPDGRVYAEEIAVQPTYHNATSDQIVVTNPTPGAVTGKTFTVTGKARGSWYFEASFPVKVLDANGKTLAAVPAQAQGDWMTSEFVPFSVSVTVPTSYIGKATLVLSKDNPSGLPQNEASIEIPFTIEY